MPVSYLHQMSHPWRHAALCWDWFMGNAVVSPVQESNNHWHFMAPCTWWIRPTAIQTHTAMILKALETRQQLWSELRDKTVSEVLWTAVWCDSIIQKTLPAELWYFFAMLPLLLLSHSKNRAVLLWDHNALANTAITSSLPLLVWFSAHYIGRNSNYVLMNYSSQDNTC